VLRVTLTLNLLTTTIVAPPSKARKWQMGFNLAFKGLNTQPYCVAAIDTIVMLQQLVLVDAFNSLCWYTVQHVFSNES
jgi:hypothetical protein